MPKILAVCLSATIQRTITFCNIALERVNRSEKYRIDASGKAVNAARVLNQLEDGCVVTVCSLGEKNADVFLDLAKCDNLKIVAIRIPGFTRECWTLLDRMRGTTTELVVSEPAAGGEYSLQEQQLLSVIGNHLEHIDAVLFAGSRPVIWPGRLVVSIAQMAMKAGKLLLADYHGNDLVHTLEICTPQIIKINNEEFCSTFGLPPVITDDVLTEAISTQSRKLGNCIVVTRGTQATIAAEKGKVVIFPTEKVKAVNTTACGDSFSAGFLYEYLLSHNFETALAKGTWCAARNAERECPGTVRD
jgi:1-phosphofructokinase